MTRLLLLIIGRATPRANREWVVGDTLEEFTRLVTQRGPAAARRWLIGEAWRVLVQAPRHRAATRGVRVRETRPELAGALAQDIRFALRVLRQRPGFTTAAIATLAFGIGANVAVFSAVRAVLLDEPPYPHADRLVSLSIPIPRMLPQPMSEEDVEAIRSRAGVFDAVGACTWANVSVRGESTLERVQGPRIAPEFLNVFGVAPLLGRSFSDDEFVNGAHVTMLSFKVWQSQFGGAPDVVGRTIQIDHEPWTIVGVMPPQFAPQCAGNGSGDVWRPFRPMPGSNEPNLLVFAKLAPGATLETARRAITDLKSANATVTLGAYGATVDGLKDRDADAARSGLLLLQGIAAFLLILTCTNLANLFLAHASARHHELGVRAALGAGRWRLVRQLLTEAMLISVAGSLFGVMLAFWIVPRLALTGPGRLGVIPTGTILAVRLPELAIALALSWLTALLFGLAPAWLTSKTDVLATLRTSQQATATRAASMLRTSLVAAEVLFAVVILSGTGLFIRSFAHVIAVPLGFDPKGVTAARIYVDAPAGTHTDLVGSLERRLHDRFGAVPVALANNFPFFGGASYTNFALAPDDAASPKWQWSEIRTVSPDYFATLRISPIRGRLLTADDAGVQPTPVLVNETFLRKLGMEPDALGRRLLRHFFGPSPSDSLLVVVGIVADVSDSFVTRPPFQAVYVPLEPHASGNLSIAVRGQNTPALERALREVAHETSPDVAVLQVSNLEASMAEREVKRRFYVLVLIVFGALAGLLAALGVYAVMSQTVGHRLREAGIRMALGARPRDIRALLVGGGLKPVAAGLAGGIVAAWWVAGLMRNNSALKGQLFQVPAQDPWSIGLTAAGLLIVGLLACWMPTRKTKQINPVEILRAE